MKHIKLIGFIVAFVLILGCICGCAAKEEASTEEETNPFSAIEGKWEAKDGSLYFISSDGTVLADNTIMTLHPVNDQTADSHIMEFISGQNVGDDTWGWVWRYNTVSNTIAVSSDNDSFVFINLTRSK